MMLSRTRRTSAAAVLFCWLMAGASHAESTFEDVADDWTPRGLRSLRVADVAASSALGSENGQYAPGNAVDRDRRTKWVADEAASQSKPQSITLRLFGSQEVAGVALFGERPGNDGVRDAQIQVAAPSGEFQTVATVQDAKSANWVAKFGGVRTPAVRLLVTRSGGVSTHTDVFEILVLGRPLPPEELKRHAGERSAACARLWKTLQESLPKLGSPATLGMLRKTLDRLEPQVNELLGRLAGWEALTEADRLDLVDQAERMELALSQSAGLWERAAAQWPKRLQDIEAARHKAAQIQSGKKPQTAREGGRVIVANPDVLVTLDEADGAWEATWRGVVPAAIRRARFSVEVDGQSLRPEKVKAEVQPFADKLGAGLAIRQTWGGPVEVERSLRVYEALPAVAVCAKIANRTGRDIAMGTARLVDVDSKDGGWWHAGSLLESPAAVFIAGISELLCEPVGDPGERAGERHYGGTGVLGLGHREPSAGLAVGFLSALEAKPDLAARFRPAAGGTALAAEQRFLGRLLAPGKTLELDPVWISTHGSLREAMESYGDAVAKSSEVPPRRGPNALWCSWYAHRMAMTEELVLANAAVAARDLRPLGFDLIQLDHGWQRGDITGDWVPNERFAHGLKWLSGELQSRHALRLGLWISPTDVAETSQTFQKHPDWMLRDGAGKPMVNWRWYWKPNPNCFELDASHPQAARFIEETFARLSAEGSQYFKIDFIAPAAGEHFQRHDQYVTPGWGVLRLAMEAVRQGAGPNAWIRYCQTPPLLSVGLADSAYGGSDTLDAGLGGNLEVLRTNARSLAAGWWINDRLYHREVCDMSVRMQAPVEEVRLRLAMMTLAGCSISFSDELQYLPPSRIRMMQQCLPAGCPPMKPLDLLGRTIPSLWHVHCKNEADAWDVVGVFNFENRPEERTIELEALGLPRDAEVIAFEFWEQRLLGVCRDRISLAMPPQSSRIVILRRLAGRPQVIATDMHLLAGLHEIKRLAWDEKTGRLSGEYQRAPGLSGRAHLYVPPGFSPHFDFPLGERSARLTNVGGGLWLQEVDFREAKLAWSIPFDKTE